MWRYWCKAIGSKAFNEDDKADIVAIIRTVLPSLLTLGDSGENTVG